MSLSGCGAKGSNDMKPGDDGGPNPPPQTTISGGPPIPSLTYATFTLTANVPATFECSLDAAAFSPCSSPQSYAQLAYGSHTFAVRATDSDGEVEDPPAEFTWDPEPTDYAMLSDTGLFADIATRQLAAGVTEFSPNFALWSDGAEKTRWIRLPPGLQINTGRPGTSASIDGWVFPIGTQFWKQFRVPGAGGRLIETRLIEIRPVGAGNLDFTGQGFSVWAGSFIWDVGGTDATLNLAGQQNVAANPTAGTTFDVPSQGGCWECHQGRAGFVLGFTALQLARAPQSQTDVTLAGLNSAGLLSTAPVGVDLANIGMPGANATERGALSFLHSNCGHCHNPQGRAWPIVDMVLLVSVSESQLPAASTALYGSTVGVPVSPSWPGGTPGNISFRIAAGNATNSGIPFRDSNRGNGYQMPPYQGMSNPQYTKVVPPAVTNLAAWINSL
jgi:hypothetical protein